MQVSKIKNELKKYPTLTKVLRPSLKAARYSKVKITSAKRRISRLPSALRWQKYRQFFLNQQLDKSDYVKIAENDYAGKKSKKLIAYYLPQYYQIPQNDEWFGRGFTEWSNCAKAVPQFNGHWQPHLPIDVGFYNLETTNAMHRQVELAKKYGLHGFCFYYYWFSGGDKIMEKPINNWLKDTSIDFPFMLFWANEDWTNTWGAKGDLGTKTYSAKMKPSDVEKFVADILPFIKDSRYITVDGRPHVIIYQSKKDPYLPTFIHKVGELIEAEGVSRPYISLVFPDDFDKNFNPLDYGADAVVEFGSHLRVMPDEIPASITDKKIVNPLAKITEYDMESYVRNRSFAFEPDFPLYKGAMTHFDNTARKVYRGAQIFSISPALYEEWLTAQINDANTDQVFITAWNEWAEGMHLEPDQRYGYAYLQATRNALEATDS